MIITKDNIKDYLSNDDLCLYLNDVDVTKIDYLPEGLEVLLCHKLTVIPDIPKSLRVLWYNNTYYNAKSSTVLKEFNLAS